MPDTEEMCRIDRKIEKAISDNVFPGAVLLCALDKKIVLHRAFGRANIIDNTLMQKNSIFDLASLTKPFVTALGISLLAGQKKIVLDQELGTLLDRFRGTDKSEITIDMLLRHTSGLPAYREYFKTLVTAGSDPKKRLRTLLAAEPLVHAPGTVQAYSDPGYMILGWIIETVSGLSLDQYIHRHLYAKLGIENLFYIPAESRELILSKYGPLIAATQNCPWRKTLLQGEVDDDNTWAVGGVDGHAGLFGDAFSLFILCCEILDALTGKQTRLIPAEIITRMARHKNGHDMVAGFDTPAKQNSSAGIYFSPSSVGHLGFTGTSFWIDPEVSLIVIFLTNRVHPSRANDKIKKFRPALHNLIREQLIKR